jgi:hypothetical protein
MIEPIFKYCLLFLLLTLIFSCNAPRNNPLDPENSENNISSIEGLIKTTRVPQTPIANTKIFWVNEGILTKSNDLGFFKIENIEQKDGWIIIEKEGYSIDSLYITFNNQKKVSKTFFLNAIPQINDFQFYSVTTNKYPSEQTYRLGAKIKITDEENDSDSVFIENIELNTNKELLYNASSKYYENSISLLDLHITSIDIVIGKEFYINVFDSDAKKFVIGNSNIKRIIKTEIETTAPSGRDTVNTKNPLFEWRRFTPGFTFRYLLEIYTDEVPANLVWQKEISSNEIQYLADVNLSSGDYFWVIWAIDEFENRTRSKPASFIIN